MQGVSAQEFLKFLATFNFYKLKYLKNPTTFFMQGVGFEPTKALSTQDLESCPFDHLGTPANRKHFSSIIKYEMLFVLIKILDIMHIKSFINDIF